MNHYEYEREAIKGKQINAYWDLEETIQRIILVSNKMRKNWYKKGKKVINRS